LTVWSISILAPAMKLSFLPLMSTMAFTEASPESSLRSASNSRPTSSERVFTASPGTSKTTVATPGAAGGSRSTWKFFFSTPALRFMEGLLRRSHVGIARSA
jgi:hypothetical protein